MTAIDGGNSLMLGTLGAILQGTILGMVVTAAFALLVKYVLRLNASTRFAVWLALLAVLCGITVGPALRELSARDPHRPQEPAAALATAPVPAAHGATAARASVSLSDTPGSRPATGRFQFELLVDRDLPVMVAALYGIVVAILMVRLLVGFLQLRRLKHRSKPVPPELAWRLDQWLAQSGCRRSVALRVAADVRGPLAAGFFRPVVIVPDFLLLAMTSGELDDVVLHELAHIRRYDDWTTLFQRVVRMLFFFHPAVHWICRELEFEREVACDDTVLAITGTAKSYARSLTRVSELAPSRRVPVLASGAVFRRPQIRRRIELLLNSARNRSPRVSAMSFSLVLLVVIGIASDIATLPAFVSLLDGGDHFRSRSTENGRTIQFDVAGQVEFGDDDISVLHMSPNALVRVEERTSWSGRKVEIRNGQSGTPVVRYFLQGSERAIDEAGRAWLAGILPRLIRDTGINAEERARRILDRNGPAALVQEADRISNDHSRRRYLTTGIQSGRFGTGEMQQALRSASRMSSDHEKANLLLEAAGDSLTPELRNWFFDAVDTISSDHDRRRVVSEVAKDAVREPEILALAARSVQRMGSDHDKAEILKQMPLDAVLSEGTVRQSVLRAAGTISSDHDKTEVLLQLVRAQEADDRAMAEILRLAQDIPSDNDKARLLEQVAPDHVSKGGARTAWFAAVRAIQSDSDRGRVLTRFLTQTQASGDLLDEFCRSAQSMGSDNEKANVLIAARPPLTPTCFEAIRSVASDHDKRRVLERLLISSASSDTSRAAVEAAATIASDSDKAEVLIRAAQQQPDDETRAAIRKVAQGLSSDEAYRRITSKLLDRAAP